MKYVIVACLLGAIAALPASALAQSEPEREQATRHFELGVQAAREMRWPDAIRELELVRSIRATASVHFNLGMAYRAVGRNRDAIAAFESFLRGTNTSGDNVRATAAQGFVTELRAGLVRLVVNVDPPNATLTINGATVRRQAEPYEMDPGQYVLAAEAPEYRAATQIVSARPSERVQIQLRLTPASSAALLHIESNVTEAAILIDGRLVSNGTVDEYVGAGEHTVEVRAPGYTTFRRVVTLEPRATIRLRAALSDRRSVVTNPWFWVGTTVVVGGLAVGGVFLFSTTASAAPSHLGDVEAITRGQ